MANPLGRALEIRHSIERQRFLPNDPDMSMTVLGEDDFCLHCGQCLLDPDLTDSLPCEICDVEPFDSSSSSSASVSYLVFEASVSYSVFEATSVFAPRWNPPATYGHMNQAELERLAHLYLHFLRMDKAKRIADFRGRLWPFTIVVNTRTLEQWKDWENSNGKK